MSNISQILQKQEIDMDKTGEHGATATDIISYHGSYEVWDWIRSSSTYAIQAQCQFVNNVTLFYPIFIVSES